LYDEKFIVTKILVAIIHRIMDILKSDETDAKILIYIVGELWFLNRNDVSEPAALFEKKILMVMSKPLVTE
jgi:hypothetical protein